MFYNQSGRSFLRRVLQIHRNFLTTCTQKSTRGAKLQADTVLCTKNERPQNRTDAKPCLSDVYKMSTRAKRRQTDVRLSGRSMVEMLGVLAIIGVLSVGAVSGYSKAMLKYKLNKQTEQISTVLNNFLLYVHEFKYDKFTVMTDFLIKLNAIPTEMIKAEKSTRSIYDALDNQYDLTCHVGSDNDYFCSIYIKMDTSKLSIESCQNIIKATKENSADVWQFLMYKNDGADSSGRKFGDKYCGNYYPCIRDMKFSDIENFCQDCTVDDKCQLAIHIK